MNYSHPTRHHRTKRKHQLHSIYTALFLAESHFRDFSHPLKHPKPAEEVETPHAIGFFK